MSRAKDFSGPNAPEITSWEEFWDALTQAGEELDRAIVAERHQIQIETVLWIIVLIIFGTIAFYATLKLCQGIEGTFKRSKKEKRQEQEDFKMKIPESIIAEPPETLLARLKKTSQELKPKWQK